MSDKAKIQAALAQLKHGDDSHWTEDGLPRVDVIQKLAHDGEIKRADISAAIPGYVRKGGATGESSDTAVDAAPQPVNIEVDVGPALDAAPEGDGEYLTEDEVRAILDQNVEDAKGQLEAARQKIRDGQAEERAATRAIAKALDDRQRRFPPITPMDNIKAHLASEQAKRIAAHNAMPNRVDMAFAAGNSRGWKRPVRPALGADGKLVMPVTRERANYPILPSVRPTRVA